MVTSRFEVTVHRPVDEVFAVLSDVENTPTWHPSAIEERFTSDGPVGVGSTRRSVGRAFGIRVENEAEVTVFEPDQALSLRSIDSPVPFEISIVLTPADDGTRIVWTEELSPTGVVSVIVRATKRLHDAQTAKGLERLKSLMESGEL